MKKLILFTVMFAITFGSGIASADRLYVPLVAHYGTSNYTQILVHNMSGLVTKVSVQFLTSSLDTKSSSQSTNSMSSSTSRTKSIAKNTTWQILTKDSNLLGTTTSMKRTVVSIQSSASDSPDRGPIGASAIFVHVNSSSDPSGFIYPVAFRINSYQWLSANTATVDIAATRATTLSDWRQ